MELYKLILVDDEADVREGVLSEIDWEGNGFLVTDVAENGCEALEMVERGVPDVIVTDIRMPFMDGLQLSERTRTLHPGVKIIILTGFDEFEYARKAIGLNIEEFVLKPFSAGELLSALSKVKLRLDTEMAERENIGSLQEHYRRSLPLLRELFLGSLITRNLSALEIREKTELYELPIEGDRYTVSVIQLDYSAKDREQGNENKSRYEFELLTFAVRNITEIVTRQEALGYVFQHNDNVVLLEINKKAAIEQHDMRSASLLEEIRQSTEKYLKKTVTIGTGTVATRPSDVRFSYADAVAALDYRMLLGNNRVIAIEDVESRSPSPIRFDELQEQSFLRCLKMGTHADMETIVDSLFSPLIQAETSCSYRDVQIFLLQMVTTMLKALQEHNQEKDERLNNDADWIKEITQFNSVKETRDWVVTTCAHTRSRIASDRQTSYQALVEQAKRYTRMHFDDSDISIARVCSHLHISTGYFSGIFKRETKMTFVSYLLYIRMEAAKELLLTTDMKAFEIAEKVGYADPNYFSFSFKKQVGVSPKDYRNRTGGVSL
jgi:two-component system response regulator YesN